MRKQSVVVAVMCSSADTGDQSERILRVAASLIEGPEVAMGKERVKRIATTDLILFSRSSLPIPKRSPCL